MLTEETSFLKNKIFKKNNNYLIEQLSNYLPPCKCTINFVQLSRSKFLGFINLHLIRFSL